MGEVDALLQSFVEVEKAHEREMVEAEAALAAAKHRVSKLHEGAPDWISDVVAPIALEFTRRLPDCVVKVAGPFGLGCTVSVAANAKENREHLVGYLQFRPGMPESGDPVVMVDLKRDTGRYAPNTMGAVNGFNHPLRELPSSMDELFQRFLVAEKTCTP